MKKWNDLLVPQHRIINLTHKPISCYTNQGDIITFPIGNWDDDTDKYYIVDYTWKGFLSDDPRFIWVSNTGIGRSGVEVSVLKLCLWPQIRVFPT